MTPEFDVEKMMEDSARFVQSLRGVRIGLADGTVLTLQDPGPCSCGTCPRDIASNGAIAAAVQHGPITPNNPVVRLELEVDAADVDIPLFESEAANITLQGLAAVATALSLEHVEERMARDTAVTATYGTAEEPLAEAKLQVEADMIARFYRDMVEPHILARRLRKAFGPGGQGGGFVIMGPGIMIIGGSPMAWPGEGQAGPD